MRIKKVRPYLSWVRTNQTGSCSFFLSCFAILNFLNARLTSLLVENRGESYLDRWVMTVNPLPPWGLEGLNPVYPESGPIRSDPAHFFVCWAAMQYSILLTTRQASLLVKNRGGSCLDRQVMTVNPLPLWGLERLDPIYHESGLIRSDPVHFFELLCNTQFFNYQTDKSNSQKQRGKLSRQASHGS